MTEVFADARAEAAAWRNRFVRLLDRSPAPTVVSESDGTILLANLSFAAAWGVRPSQLRGRDLRGLFTLPDMRPLRKLGQGIARGSRARYPIQVRWEVGGVVHSGELTVEPVSDEIIEPPPLLSTLRIDPGGRSTPELAPREAEILELVAAVVTTAVTARTVGLTVDGVNYHLARLCGRLGAPNRTALVARAYVLGLLDPRAWPPVRS